MIVMNRTLISMRSDEEMKRIFDTEKEFYRRGEENSDPSDDKDVNNYIWLINIIINW